MNETKALTTSEDMAAEVAGGDLHPADALLDPPHGEWAKNGSAKREDRYGGELGAILEEAGERLIDQDGVSRSPPSTEVGKTKPDRPKRYRAGSTDISVDASIGQSAIDALWSGSGAPERRARVGLVKGVFESVKPRNELDGLLAAQLVAAHGAAIECYRRAMIPEQPSACRSENLNQAAKASRTFAALLEALDRHRGKGSQQRVRVEHVHVYEGGQAIVGNVAPGGGGGGKNPKKRQPHALSHSPEPSLPSQDAERQPMPRASDGERQVSDARRQQHGRADG